VTRTITHYHQQAKHFQSLYDSVSAQQIHQDWSYLIERLTPGFALDIGAGSGRDARWLASKGWQVVAAEPAQALRELAQKSSGPEVLWSAASLPELIELPTTPTTYQLILLSAVWMHIPPSERKLAFQTIAERLATDGLIVISLRFGPSDSKRPMYEVSVAEVQQLAAACNLRTEVLSPASTSDKLGRQEVSWQTLLLKQELA